MISFLLSIVAALVGAAFAVPGLLPKASAVVVQASRVATGSGLVVMAAGRLLQADGIVELGFLFVVAGLAAFIAAVVRCA